MWAMTWRTQDKDTFETWKDIKRDKVRNPMRHDETRKKVTTLPRCPRELRRAQDFSSESCFAPGIWGTSVCFTTSALCLWCCYLSLAVWSRTARVYNMWTARQGRLCQCCRSCGSRSCLKDFTQFHNVAAMLPYAAMNFSQDASQKDVTIKVEKPDEQHEVGKTWEDMRILGNCIGIMYANVYVCIVNCGERWESAPLILAPSPPCPMSPFNIILHMFFICSHTHTHYS